MKIFDMLKAAALAVVITLLALTPVALAQNSPCIPRNGVACVETISDLTQMFGPIPSISRIYTNGREIFLYVWDDNEQHSRYFGSENGGKTFSLFFNPTNNSSFPLPTQEGLAVGLGISHEKTNGAYKIINGQVLPVVVSGDEVLISGQPNPLRVDHIGLPVLTPLGDLAHMDVRGRNGLFLRKTGETEWAQIFSLIGVNSWIQPTGPRSYGDDVYFVEVRNPGEYQGDFLVRFNLATRVKTDIHRLRSAGYHWGDPIEGRPLHGYSLLNDNSESGGVFLQVRYSDGMADRSYVAKVVGNRLKVVFDTPATIEGAAITPAVQSMNAKIGLLGAIFIKSRPEDPWRGGLSLWNGGESSVLANGSEGFVGIATAVWGCSGYFVEGGFLKKGYVPCIQTGPSQVSANGQVVLTGDNFLTGNPLVDIVIGDEVIVPTLVSNSRLEFFAPSLGGNYNPRVRMTYPGGQKVVSASWDLFVDGPMSPAILSFTAEPTEVGPDEESRLCVSISLADSLTINPGGLAVGQDGCVSVTMNETTTYTATAINAVGSASANVTVTVTTDPRLNEGGVVSASSGKADDITIGGYVSAYGVRLSPEVVVIDWVTLGRFPTFYQFENGPKVQVFMAGIECPLQFLGPNQINFLVPAGVPVGVEAPVQIVWIWEDGRVVTSNPVLVTTRETAPTLFVSNGEPAVVSITTGQQITAENPAKPDEWLAFFGQGFGQTDTPIGQPYPVDPLAVVSDPPSVKYFGRPLERAFVGGAPTFIGLQQMNCRAPVPLPGDTGGVLPPSPFKVWISVGESGGFNLWMGEAQ